MLRDCSFLPPLDHPPKAAKTRSDPGPRQDEGGLQATPPPGFHSHGHELLPAASQHSTPGSPCTPHRCGSHVAGPPTAGRAL
eukprot:scaffold3625_cov372-Prasinococcus_capsulatus_cf.AAC.5